MYLSIEYFTSLVRSSGFLLLLHLKEMQLICMKYRRKFINVNGKQRYIFLQQLPITNVKFKFLLMLHQLNLDSM